MLSHFWKGNTRGNEGAAAEGSDTQTGYKQVTAGEKLKTSAVTKVKSKTVRKYLLQFDQLTLKKGVLYHFYINNDVEYHQRV